MTVGNCTLTPCEDAQQIFKSLSVLIMNSDNLKYGATVTFDIFNVMMHRCVMTVFCHGIVRCYDSVGVRHIKKL